MQATKPLTKWQKFWRRANRPTPFWKQRIEERTGGELGPKGLLDQFFGWVGDISLTLVLLIYGALIISMLTTFVIGPVFLSPGFMEYGLADPIGRGLAAVCLSTGLCDPGYLLAGTAFGVMVLLLLFLVPMYAIWHSDDGDDDGSVDDREFAAGMRALTDLVVHLRADLVLAGVLPLTTDEKADAEEPA